ncbi:uncharacterized protein B0I36DRAFT_351449 [Microdochium trichocladiopsis]|uniref:Transmembrane protein n=1 Tax=Microdochium trichocladiopsis TaxID=1682393 RepID=A0A9P9BNR1_9PEZI|nr:uncharacterized protein B0I36DRAFT_351449 [Microdochium trichocladiopsis]KAH7028001.1 hypothetical protein B0I36DRAFT_351449 [Microdochium trichocladiopsis]
MYSRFASLLTTTSSHNGTYTAEEVAAYQASVAKWTKIYGIILAVLVAHYVAITIFFWWQFRFGEAVDSHHHHHLSHPGSSSARDTRPKYNPVHCRRGCAARERARRHRERALARQLASGAAPGNGNDEDGESSDSGAEQWSWLTPEIHYPECFDSPSSTPPPPPPPPGAGPSWRGKYPDSPGSSPSPEQQQQHQNMTGDGFVSDHLFFAADLESGLHGSGRPSSPELFRPRAHGLGIALPAHDYELHDYGGKSNNNSSGSGFHGTYPFACPAGAGAGTDTTTTAAVDGTNHPAVLPSIGLSLLHQGPANGHSSGEARGRGRSNTTASTATFASRASTVFGGSPDIPGGGPHNRPAA